MLSRRVVPVTALLLTLAPLGACSDDGTATTPRPLASVAPGTATAAPTETEDPAGAGTVQPEDEAQAAYLAWLGALAARDAETACAIQHPELTIALRQEAILVGRARLGDPCTGFEALLWEDPQRETGPVSVETTTLTGEKAVLAVGFGASAVTVELEYQRAAWRVLAEEPRTLGSPATRRWVERWCDLRTGMDRGELEELMGPASGTYSLLDGGEPQVYWTDRQYDFRAYLTEVTPAGTALDLVGDYDALSSTDREQLDCPELR